MMLPDMETSMNEGVMMSASNLEAVRPRRTVHRILDRLRGNVARLLLATGAFFGVGGGLALISSAPPAAAWTTSLSATPEY
jgi:hypothetical protein